MHVSERSRRTDKQNSMAGKALADRDKEKVTQPIQICNVDLISVVYHDAGQ